MYTPAIKRSFFLGLYPATKKGFSIFNVRLAVRRIEPTTTGFLAERLTRLATMIHQQLYMMRIIPQQLYMTRMQIVNCCFHILEIKVKKLF